MIEKSPQRRRRRLSHNVGHAPLRVFVAAALGWAALSIPAATAQAPSPAPAAAEDTSAPVVAAPTSCVADYGLCGGSANAAGNPTACCGKSWLCKADSKYVSFCKPPPKVKAYNLNFTMSIDDVSAILADPTDTMAQLYSVMYTQMYDWVGTGFQGFWLKDVNGQEPRAFRKGGGVLDAKAAANGPKQTSAGDDAITTSDDAAGDDATASSTKGTSSATPSAGNGRRRLGTGLATMELIYQAKLVLERDIFQAEITDRASWKVLEGRIHAGPIPDMEAAVVSYVDIIIYPTPAPTPAPDIFEPNTIPIGKVVAGSMAAFAFVVIASCAVRYKFKQAKRNREADDGSSNGNIKSMGPVRSGNGSEPPSPFMETISPLYGPGSEAAKNAGAPPMGAEAVAKVWPAST